MSDVTTTEQEPNCLQSQLTQARVSHAEDVCILQERLAHIEAELTIARKFLVRQGFYRCAEPACGCGGKDWHERLTP